VSVGGFDEALVRRGQAALDDMARASAALVQAVLLSDDGFEVARAPRTTVSDGRFASMASSVQALSEAVVHELRIGDGSAVIIQASQGLVIQARVAAQPVVVSALFRTGESLGSCLVAMRQAVASLEAAFRDGSLAVQS